ncbi:hypothetical protein [Loigolactobacillus iwatensis]|uniref:hypothetical protein n=1 Tax=Loigolactobacillus iwatensis TaxID=1267156 RepID=UPI000F7D8825|nr:hypothetical protein [Loigolactobacillus iwatensis]
MLDVIDSINRLSWTVEHHYTHIEAQHPFMRAFAVQFELAYTDFRVIQMALQLVGDQHSLLVAFTAVYDQVYKFDYEFAANGPEAFKEKYAGQLSVYQTAKDELLGRLEQIKQLQS